MTEANSESNEGKGKGTRDRCMAAVVCGLLLLAVALVFGQTVRFEFVNFDDQVYVYENHHVRQGVTLQNIVWAFTTLDADNWHPLTWLSHMLDVQFYGLWTGGHHLTNVLLHATSVVVLFLVLRRMTGRLWPSAAVAAVFAIHPLHVESVAWVAERKDVLSGLFFMLTLAAYLGYVRRPFSVWRYLLVVVCFALGLMSKPMLVTLPLVLLLLDYWPLGRWGFPSTADTPAQNQTPFSWRVLTEKVPLVLLAAASCVATMMAQTKAMITLEEFPFPYRAANALISYVAYLAQSLRPTELAVLYPLPKRAPSWWIVGGCAILLLGITITVVHWRRGRPYLMIGWLWYLGMVVPVIGLIQVGAQARADRYMYLPLVGLAMALAWATADFTACSALRRRLCGTAWLVILALLTGLAWQQANCWRESETLWAQALKVTDDNHMAHGNLSVALVGRGQVDEAVAHCRSALEIKPDYAEAHNNLALALAGRGQVDEAIDHYRKALRIKPDLAEAHYNLGNALADCGQVDEAIACYRNALAIKPNYAETHNNLGESLARSGRIDEAMTHFQQALEIKPEYAEGHYNLGVALAGRGQVDKAMTHYRKALKSKPDHAEAHNNLAAALAGRGQLDEAVIHLRKALEIKPEYVDARRNLSILMSARKRAFPPADCTVAGNRTAKQPGVESRQRTPKEKGETQQGKGK